MTTRRINSNTSSSRATSPEPQRSDSESQSPAGDPQRPPGRLGATDRPGGPPPRANTPAQLVIPPLADRLSASGLAGLALLGESSILNEIRSHLQVARIATHEAPSVRTSQQFQSLLGVSSAPQREGGSLHTLPAPPHLRAQALVAAGARINSLPPADRTRAMEDFLDFPFDASDDVLDNLRHAVRDVGAQAFVDREALLAAPGGPAHLALQRGEGTIREIMQRHSLFSTSTDNALQKYAFKIGRAAVENGETTTSVIRRLGITDEMLNRRLRLHAAQHAFDQGSHNIDDLGRRFDLSSPGHSSIPLALEYHAVKGAGREAIARGESVMSVAVRMGIHHVDPIALLAQQAEVKTFDQFTALLGDPSIPAPPKQRAKALAAVGSSIMSLPEEADQHRAVQAFLAFDKADPAYRKFRTIRRLLNLQRSTRDSTALLDDLRYHVNLPDPRQALEDAEAINVSMRGAASAAVTDTSNVRDVARRHGISGARAIRVLNELAYPFAVMALEANRGTIEQVAKNRGITEPEWLEALARRASRLAAQAVAGGQMPADVVRRLGITNPTVVENLSFRGARRAMNLEHHSIDALQEQFGLTPRARHRLELYAVEGTAGAAVRRLHSVISVAGSVGIHDADNLSRLVHQVDIRNVDQFRALLNAPTEVRQALPAPVRAAALAALGGRIMALPESDRDAAARAFVEFQHEGESTALFDDLRLAASRGEAGLREREMRLVALGGAAAAEVGQIDPGEIARRHGISGADAISALQQVDPGRVALP